MGAVNQKGGASAPPSIHDELQREATIAATEAIFPILENAIEHNPTRQINTLTREEIEFMAVAAIVGWVLKRAEQEQVWKDRLPDTMELLMP